MLIKKFSEKNYIGINFKVEKKFMCVFNVSVGINGVSI